MSRRTPTGPTITVITPCFDDDATLSMALASLLAQTVDDWECIVVDDGNSEAVAPVVERFDDDRFRLIVFESNRGRSVARQRALEEAQGQFICLLDADDWYYPEKLQRQLQAMEEHPDLAAVGAGIAVMNDREELSGIRCYDPSGLQVHTGPRHHFPSVFVPSVMLRRKAALAHEFNPNLERSEDRDYLKRVLAGKRYGVLPRVLYAYREVYSDRSMGEALCGFRNQRKVFRDRLFEAPVQLGKQFAWSLVKSGVYGAARAVGRGRWLFERRNRAPTHQERREFERSRREIREVLGEKSGE